MYTYILYYICAFLFRDDPSTQRKKSWKQICPTLGHIPKINKNHPNYIWIGYLHNWFMFLLLAKPPKAMAFWEFFESPRPWGPLRDAPKHHICGSAEGTIRHGDTSPQKPGVSGVYFVKKTTFLQSLAILAHEWLNVDFSWFFIVFIIAMVITDCFHAWMPMG